jgi:predicted RNA binding protein YcfA (HicA-like mRNA interferase family)
MNFKEPEKIIKADGWSLARTKGSHHIYIHPAKPGIVSMPFHKGDINIKTVNSVFRQAGIKTGSKP